MKEMNALADVYQNKDVLEIIVDSYKDVYWEEGGKTHESDSLFKNEDEIMALVDSLLNSVGRNRDSIKDGFGEIKLGDGTKVTVALPPLSLNGPALVIRKMPSNKVSASDLISWKCIDESGWKICQKLLDSQKNIVLAGNAGSGKTTVLNLLTDSMDKKSRVVTIEKSAEMQTFDRKRTLRLESPNGKQHEMKDLISKVGVLRADYFVVNELRGSEAFEAINLMREGYSTLATVMAEGVRGALKKLEVFCLMDNLNISPNEIKFHVGTGVDAVIFQERLPDGKRVVSNISFVKGLDENNEYICEPLFYYDEEEGVFVTTDKGRSLF